MRKWTGRTTLGAGVALAALLGATAGWSQNDRNAANEEQQPATRNIEMVPAMAELQKGLNAKNLKPGQMVTAKLEKTVNLPNEPALTRNTVLVGRVDAVEASQQLQSHGDLQPGEAKGRHRTAGEGDSDGGDGPGAAGDSWRRSDAGGWNGAGIRAGTERRRAGSVS